MLDEEKIEAGFFDCVRQLYKRSKPKDVQDSFLLFTFKQILQQVNQGRLVIDHDICIRFLDMILWSKKDKKLSAAQRLRTNYAGYTDFMLQLYSRQRMEPNMALLDKLLEYDLRFVADEQNLIECGWFFFQKLVPSQETQFVICQSKKVQRMMEQLSVQLGEIGVDFPRALNKGASFMEKEEKYDNLLKIFIKNSTVDDHGGKENGQENITNDALPSQQTSTQKSVETFEKYAKRKSTEPNHKNARNFIVKDIEGHVYRDLQAGITVETLVFQCCHYLPFTRAIDTILRVGKSSSYGSEITLARNILSFKNSASYTCFTIMFQQAVELRKK